MTVGGKHCGNIAGKFWYIFQYYKIDVPSIIRLWFKFFGDQGTVSLEKCQTFPGMTWTELPNVQHQVQSVLPSTLFKESYNYTTERAFSKQ